MFIASMISRTAVLSVVLAAALIAGISNRAQATEELRKELAVVAENIAGALKGLEESSVSIGTFSGPPTLPTSAGPMFTKLLGEELAKHEITIKTRSKYGVKGEYMDVIDAATGKLAAQIKGELLDRNNTPLVTFNRGVTGETTLATLFGITAELPANTRPEKRDEALKEGLDNPQVFINESKVAASKESPYAVELFVKGPDGFKPRPAVDDEGLAFCNITREELYALRLHNNSPFDAAVTLTIDGLSVFAFSENKNYSHFIVPANSVADILGWHRTNAKADAFKIVAYADSEVAKALPNSTTVGTITAIFAAAWNEGSDPPPDEAARAKDGAVDATGRGPEVATGFTEVVKEVGRPRSTVSVRYSKPTPADLPGLEP